MAKEKYEISGRRAGQTKLMANLSKEKVRARCLENINCFGETKKK